MFSGVPNGPLRLSPPQVHAAVHNSGVTECEYSVQNTPLGAGPQGPLLPAWFHRDGRQWLAWCPDIDVMTQASSRKQALESLKEAVELWFESSIDRGVLGAALREVGFTE